MTTRTAPPTPGDGDMYGIVSRNTWMRDMYGDRRCHGTVSTVPAPLFAIYERPTEIGPRVIVWQGVAQERRT